jgi:hypothetical protein
MIEFIAMLQLSKNVDYVQMVYMGMTDTKALCKKITVDAGHFDDYYWYKDKRCFGVNDTGKV